jgi:2-polyprenyl-3-methyl-5-hydroxy-6-metoxy-1,4-benzoquinol methylase
MGGYRDHYSSNYAGNAPTDAHAFLWPPLQGLIAAHDWPERRAIELGCGNGATALMLAGCGFAVTAIDSSESGIAQLRNTNASVAAELASVYDDLPARFGRFPLVVSLEVVEHLYDPHAFARNFLALIAPGGIGFLSTPYHGYAKNLLLALTGKLERHLGAADWIDGHIKFFSIRSLTQLLRQNGAEGAIRFERVGRWPRALAKSMIAITSG